MLNEFKAFILRGNVVDLAVGVVIGAAFAAVVTSLVEDVFTPFLALFGERNFDELSFGVGGGEVRYGNFLNNLFAFVLIAAVVFFLVIKPVNALMARRKTEPEVETSTAPCPHCLSSIPASARVCAFCTRDVVEAPARAAPARKRRPPPPPNA